MNIEHFTLVSALMLGLVGSLHCAGMCGPIAISLPLNNASWFTRISGGLLYNTGRIITYGILGAVFGLAGMGLALGGMQQWISIILGAIMILAVIIPKLGRAGRKIAGLSDILTDHLKKPFIRLFRLRTYGSLFIIGLLNGFLPCGLVYIALAGALVSGNIIEGSAYMVLFGAGTIPMLLALSIAGNLISSRVRQRLGKVIPVFIVVLGILFILRGLNLGIPYISPKIIQDNEKATMECCKPKK